MPNSPAPRRSTAITKAGTEQRIMTPEMQDFLDAIPMLVMAGSAIAAVVAWLINRRDKQRAAQLSAAELARENAEKARILERQNHLDELRAAEASREAERREMREDRDQFYSKLLHELDRITLAYESMRERHDEEMTRGISLRAALADAALREKDLQATIIELTKEVKKLQGVVSDMERRLEAREAKTDARDAAEDLRHVKPG